MLKVIFTVALICYLALSLPANAQEIPRAEYDARIKAEDEAEAKYNRLVAEHAPQEEIDHACYTFASLVGADYMKYPAPEPPKVVEVVPTSPSVPLTHAQEMQIRKAAIAARKVEDERLYQLAKKQMHDDWLKGYSHHGFDMFDTTYLVNDGGTLKLVETKRYKRTKLYGITCKIIGGALTGYVTAISVPVYNVNPSSTSGTGY